MDPNGIGPIGHDDRVKHDDAANAENLLVPFVVAICVLNTGLNGGLRPGFPISVNPQQEITICYCIYIYIHVCIRMYLYLCIFIYIYAHTHRQPYNIQYCGMTANKTCFLVN